MSNEAQANLLPERRVTSLTEDRVALMINESFDERMAETEKRLTDHIDKKIDEVKKIFTEHVEEAFPQGPLYMHKHYHQGRIKSAESSDKIKADLIGWIIKGGLGIVFFLIAIGAMEWLKRELSK